MQTSALYRCTHRAKPGLKALAVLLFSPTILLFSPTLILAQGPRHPGLYLPPAPSYVVAPSETAVQLQFGTVPLTTVQTQLNAARVANPDSPPAGRAAGTLIRRPI